MAASRSSEILHILYTFSGVLRLLWNWKSCRSSWLCCAGVPTPKDLIAAGTVFTDEQVAKLGWGPGLPMFVKPLATAPTTALRALLREELAALELLQANRASAPQWGEHWGTRLPFCHWQRGTQQLCQSLRLLRAMSSTALRQIWASIPASCIPACLEPAVYARAQELAIKAHNALGCRGVFVVTLLLRSDHMSQRCLRQIPWYDRTFFAARLAQNMALISELALALLSLRLSGSSVDLGYALALKALQLEELILSVPLCSS